MNIQFKKNREIHTFLYNTLENAHVSIKAAIAWFTDPELFKLLLYKKNKGVDVSIILNNDVINRTLIKLGMLKESIRFSNILKKNYIMHHKFCIVDDKRVLTGSYNWTVRARRHNNENLLSIEIPEIVTKYLKEFDLLFKYSEAQTKVQALQPNDELQRVEDVILLKLEEQYNHDIMERIEKIKNTGAGVDILLLHDLIGHHTPVMAAKKLAEDPKYVQNGLLKLLEKKQARSFI